MPNWSEEVFVTKKVKNTVPWTYVINDLNGEEIMGTFYEKELQKTKNVLTLPAHPLTNFEIQEYYQNEPRFNGVFSRDNLPNYIKIKRCLCN